MLTEKEFVSCCKMCGTNDLVLYASENLKKNDFILNELEDRELRDFADEIYGIGSSISNWHDIACMFPEFSIEDIKKLDTTRLITNSFSPSKELFFKIQ